MALLELAAAAASVGILPETLNGLRRRNRIGAYRDGLNWLFDEHDVRIVVAELGSDAAAMQQASEPPQRAASPTAPAANVRRPAKAIDPIAAFHKAVSDIAGRNPLPLSRQAAIRKVAATQPALHAAYLKATNATKRV